MNETDVIIIGAGAAGMFAAIEAAARGRRVVLLEKNKRPGEKIRISGGGRCNFTNLHIAPEAYLSENPKFALSALRRFSQWDFIQRVDQAGIPWHEKTLGQLFCDHSARDLLEMLHAAMQRGGVDLRPGQTIRATTRIDGGFEVATETGLLRAQSLVVATGGLSIPKMGASGLGYEIARQFGLRIVPTRAGLVPFTFGPDVLEQTRALAGLSVPARVSTGSAGFEEGFLFTHRGLSGPSILQVSSYWQPGSEIAVNLTPGQDCFAHLKAGAGSKTVQNLLAEILPKRLAAMLTARLKPGAKRGDLSDRALRELAAGIEDWRLVPAGTEGYRTAEVTLGGVSTEDLDARTMEARAVPGLYFVGEVVDVTGWLGGYNFQWAWSSGWAAGQVA